MRPSPVPITNIGGFSHWRSGGEDPGFRTAVRALRGTVQPPPPQPVGDFSVTGASALSVRVSKVISSNYSIARTNGFSDAVVVTIEKPAGLNATLVVTPSTLSGTTTTTSLKVTTTRSTAPGIYTVKLKFTGGAIVREQLVQLTVKK